MEKIFAIHLLNRNVFPYYIKDPYQIIRNQTTQQGKRVKSVFFKEPNGQWTYEKMLSIPNCQRNAIKTTTWYHYPANIFAKIKRLIIPRAVKDTEQLETSQIAGRSANWYSCPGKIFGSIYILKLNRYIPSDSAIPNPRYIIWRNACLRSSKKRYGMLILALFVIARNTQTYVNNSIYKLCHIHKMDHTTVLSNTEPLVTCTF